MTIEDRIFLFLVMFCQNIWSYASFYENFESFFIWRCLTRNWVAFQFNAWTIFSQNLYIFQPYMFSLKSLCSNANLLSLMNIRASFKYSFINLSRYLLSCAAACIVIKSAFTFEADATCPSSLLSAAIKRSFIDSSPSIVSLSIFRNFYIPP